GPRSRVQARSVFRHAGSRAAETHRVEGGAGASGSSIVTRSLPLRELGDRHDRRIESEMVRDFGDRRIGMLVTPDRIRTFVSERDDVEIGGLTLVGTIARIDGALGL